ncbi:hypothetical protein TRVL_05993 [Trypanosoma vivax]|nr:hypothetical protein TRVL_05993 [Trypanosoma vivax]
MVGRAAWRACARTPFKKSGGARSLLEVAIPLSPSAPNYCPFFERQTKPGDAGHLIVVPGSSTLARRKPERPHHARSDTTGVGKNLTATREEVCSTTGTLGRMGLFEHFPARAGMPR